jgi:hypothetical protein
VPADGGGSGPATPGSGQLGVLSGDPVVPAPRVRRVPGEDAVERELAPPARVRVEGLAASDPAAFLLVVRVEDLAAPDPADVDLVARAVPDPAEAALVPRVLDPADAALVRVEEVVDSADAALAPRPAVPRPELDAAVWLERSTACSRARTRCWRRATSSLVAMPSRPSWRLTSRWTSRARISRFFWVRRIMSSATRPTWADCTSPCLASRPATRSAWARVSSLRLANACRYCSLPLGT